MLSHTRFKLPALTTPAYKLLTALRAGPCNFWVATERAGLDFEAETFQETLLRRAFDVLIDTGCASTNGHKFAISDRAKAALERADVAAYQAQVAEAARLAVKVVRGKIDRRAA